jgi:hypothetical protein
VLEQARRWEERVGLRRAGEGIDAEAAGEELDDMSLTGSCLTDARTAPSAERRARCRACQ